MHKLRVAAAIMLVAAFAALTGCSNFGSTVIMVVGKAQTGQYWESIQAGMNSQAETENVVVKYYAPTDPNNAAEQLDLLRKAVDTRPSAIAFAPIDPASGSAMAKEIHDAGIPMIAFDTIMEGYAARTTVATDNNAAAAEAARHMCDLIDGKGQVLFVADTVGHQTEIDRYLGFQAGLESICPVVTLLEMARADGDPAALSEQIKNALTNKELAGIFISNASLADPVLTVVESSKAKPVLIGFDSGKRQIEAIKSGVMAGAIAQNPTGIGAQVVTSAAKIIDGQTLPHLIDTGYFWYDKSNIDKDPIKAVIFE